MPWKIIATSKLYALLSIVDRRNAPVGATPPTAISALPLFLKLGETG
jgi:hypothetical protein